MQNYSNNCKALNVKSPYYTCKKYYNPLWYDFTPKIVLMVHIFEI